MDNAVISNVTIGTDNTVKITVGMHNTLFGHETDIADWPLSLMG